MSRWVTSETAALQEMRARLREEIAAVPPYPDLIGDRRMIRFLRGREGNVEAASRLYADFLVWYMKNNVPAIRHKILYEGVNHPFKFPSGEKIIDLWPQIVIAPKNRDYKKQPITLETFGFDPANVLRNVDVESYLLFLVYTLEYRALILEQMSEEIEQEYLKEHPDPSTRSDGYGVVLKTCTIRDLKGVGISHAGSKAKALIKASLDIALPNYPEYLGKSHMINVPWIFNALWAFVKGFLDAAVLAKISLCGSDYLPILLEEMPISSIPVSLGGELQAYNESYSFDISTTGPFFNSAIGFPTTIPADLSTRSSVDALSNPNAASNSLQVLPPSSSSSLSGEPLSREDDASAATVIVMTPTPTTTTSSSSAVSISSSSHEEVHGHSSHKKHKSHRRKLSETFSQLTGHLKVDASPGAATTAHSTSSAAGSTAGVRSEATKDPLALSDSQLQQLQLEALLPYHVESPSTAQRSRKHLATTRKSRDESALFPSPLKSAITTPVGHHHAHHTTHLKVGGLHHEQHLSSHGFSHSKQTPETSVNDNSSTTSSSKRLSLRKLSLPKLTDLFNAVPLRRNKQSSNSINSLVETATTSVESARGGSAHYTGSVDPGQGGKSGYNSNDRNVNTITTAALEVHNLFTPRRHSRVEDELQDHVAAPGDAVPPGLVGKEEVVAALQGGDDASLQPKQQQQQPQHQQQQQYKEISPGEREALPSNSIHSSMLSSQSRRRKIYRIILAAILLLVMATLYLLWGEHRVTVTISSIHSEASASFTSHLYLWVIGFIMAGTLAELIVVGF